LRGYVTETANQLFCLKLATYAKHCEPCPEGLGSCIRRDVHSYVRHLLSYYVTWPPAGVELTCIGLSVDHWLFTRQKKKVKGTFTCKTCYEGQGQLLLWQKRVVGVRLVEDVTGRQHCERTAVEERETGRPQPRNIYRNT